MTRMLVAVGGNALIRDGQKGTIAEQIDNARALAVEIGALVSEGHGVVLTHGNGPQVGFIMLRSELVAGNAFVPRLPLDLCVADSQGGIGYILTHALTSELRRRNLGEKVACVLTHSVVDAKDPAFSRPTKPIGPFFSKAEAEEHETHFGWTVIEDSGRGHRRVVPSPVPKRIVEEPAIGALVDAGFLVVAVGGGGIPVVETDDGGIVGVEAVIDKDYASALLATHLRLPRLVISTGVERVAVDFGRPTQRFLDVLPAAEARRHLEDGQFPEGSMGPKIRAALRFLEAGGEEVLVTSPFGLAAAVAGRTGTRIVP
jgi:carbamate kinase